MSSSAQSSVVTDSAAADIAALVTGDLPDDGVADYRFDVSYPSGDTWLVDDPYRFWPTLGDIDLYLLGEGRHERLWNRLGLSPGLLPDAVVVTPTGGLAGVAPDQAATVLKRCVALAGWFEEEFGAGG